MADRCEHALVADEGARAKARSQFEALVTDAQGQDVLERCRRLNEFLRQARSQCSCESA
jgi:hypothetical protein